jgi:hypothetical protein
MLGTMKRDSFDVESVPWWYRLMMDAAVLIVGLTWWLLTPYFVIAKWRYEARLAAEGRRARDLQSRPGD